MWSAVDFFVGNPRRFTKSGGEGDVPGWLVIIRYRLDTIKRSQISWSHEIWLFRRHEATNTGQNVNASEVGENFVTMGRVGRGGG